MEQHNESMKKAEESAIEEVTKMIRGYFQKHQESVDKKELNINRLEDILLETRSEAERIIKQAANDAMRATESQMVEKKNCVPDVEKN